MQTILGNFWEEEFDDLDMQDERLNSRLIHILCNMGSNQGKSINQLCSNKKESKATYRFLDNEKFEVNEVMQLHFEKTAERCCEHKTVVLIQDTTSFNFNHESIKGLGGIGGKLGRNKVESKGIYCHNLLAFTENGEPLGLFDQQVWSRSTESKIKKTQPREKESYRWTSSISKPNLIEDSGTQFIVLSDRESDIKIYQNSLIEMGFDFVIRAKTPRIDQIRMQDIKDVEAHSTIIDVDIVNRTSINSHRRKPKKIRYDHKDQSTKFKLNYFGAKVLVKDLDGKGKESQVNVVTLKEVTPKKDTQPVEWVLMTSLEVNTIEEALKVVELYKSRWRIEVYHKAQKSGCHIEKTRLRSKERLQRYIALQSLISFGICRIRYLLNSHPEEPAENYFDKETVSLVYQFAAEKIKKETKIKVKEFIFMLANFNGYKSYKLETPPGVVVLSNSIRIFNTMLSGYNLALNQKNVGRC